MSVNANRMSIENRPEYQAAMIQREADGLEKLNPEHRATAERARHYIRCLTLGTAAMLVPERLIEHDMDDETVS